MFSFASCKCDRPVVTRLFSLVALSVTIYNKVNNLHIIGSTVWTYTKFSKLIYFYMDVHNKLIRQQQNRYVQIFNKKTSNKPISAKQYLESENFPHHLRRQAREAYFGTSVELINQATVSLAPVEWHHTQEQGAIVGRQVPTGSSTRSPHGSHEAPLLTVHYRLVRPHVHFFLTSHFASQSDNKRMDSTVFVQHFFYHAQSEQNCVSTSTFTYLVRLH